MSVRGARDLIFGVFGLVLAALSAGTEARAQTYTSNYTWDANRRLTMVVKADPGTGVRPATKYTYDADGELIETDQGTTNSAGGSFAALETTLVAYDAAGNTAQTTVLNGTSTPALAITQTSYDADDRPTCVAVRMNPAVYASLPSSACALGTTGSYGADRITKADYDPAGQTTDVIRAYGDPLQETYETFAYTANGKQLTVTDAVGNLTGYAYDGFDRLIRTNFPSTTRAAGLADLNDFEAYAYDANGNRTTLTKRDGTVITFTYDALNRETLKSAPALGSQAAYQVATTYDLMNRKLSALFGGGQGVVYAYDAAGRLTSETTNSRALSFQYDAASNRTRVTWPDAFYATYAYDALNRVTGITDSGSTSLATYSYDSLGRRTSIARGNGTSTAYGYDNADRLTSLGQTFPSNTTSNEAYTFAYNPASQDLSTGGSNSLYQWSNHPVANTAKTYDGLNRDAAIASVGTQPCGLTSGYDCNGNLLNTGSYAYAYDMENRLTSVSTVSPSASVITLAYDPLGRLQQTVTPSATTQFLYDGDRLAAEYSASGVLQHRYVHGPGTDEPLVWYDVHTGSAVLNWLHMDRQGSVIAQSNAAGAVTQTYAYGPYGEPQTWGGSRFAYTGQIQIAEAQLYHYKARAYDPSTGRFLQTDPIGYTSDVDLYAYVAEDPSNRSDPTGECDPAGNYAGGACIQFDSIDVANYASKPDAWSSGGQVAHAAKPDETKPKPQRINSPARGPAGTTAVIPGHNGSETERTYGSKGDSEGNAGAEVDIDRGHDHGDGDPHAHDWDWKKDPPRQPSRPLTPEEQAREDGRSKATKVVAVTVGGVTGGYILYRIIRMLPSLFPPLWETIPANAVIP